jgi:hypothetical protein
MVYNLAMKADKNSIVSAKPIENLIFIIRGQRVMLDADLAALYGVPTKVFNQAIKRNLNRFPGDFMFQLTEEETQSLRSQIVTSKQGRGGRRYLPYAFTEHGTVMAANILNSDRATQASVFVVRAFVKLREILATHKEIAAKVAELERKLTSHDRQIIEIVKVIKKLMTPPKADPKPIGFAAPKKN